MAGSDFFANRGKLMNLPVRPGHVFHPDSQEMLDRPEHSITLRETVQRACGNSWPLDKGLKRLKGRNGLPDIDLMWWPCWCPGTWLHVNSQILTSLPRRVVHGNSWYQLRFHLPFQGSK